MNIKNKSSVELMNLYAEILAELNRRNVVRTYNSPVGDYAEWLVAEKLGLVLEHNSQKGYDAYQPGTGLRYQIKSRWERGDASVQSRELNVIRNYDDNQFDYLIIVIFNDRFGVKEGYMLPHDTIKPYARYNRHQNGYILMAKGAVLSDKSTLNITDQLQ